MHRMATPAHCKKCRLFGWRSARLGRCEKCFQLREQLNGGLLDKLISGVGMGHGLRLSLPHANDFERCTNGCDRAPRRLKQI
jgi:hypothetical protein